jgi:predicted TIM-barrel fold metal-dependent hydrolase
VTSFISFNCESLLSFSRTWRNGKRRHNCARELVGIEHIVFGTDYFIRGTHFMEWTSEFIDGLGLRSAEREMVYEKKASRILKL